MRSSENLADLATRRMTSHGLIRSEVWWHIPKNILENTDVTDTDHKYETTVEWKNEIASFNALSCSRAYIQGQRSKVIQVLRHCLHLYGDQSSAEVNRVIAVRNNEARLYQ